MFCTKCGAQNPDGSAFCVSCGNKLQSAGMPAQPQVQYTQPQGYGAQPNMYAPQPNAYAGYQVQKNKKGLMIGLIIGGVVLIAGIVVLIVLLTGGNASSGILGTWYEQTGFGGTMTFNANGTFDMTVMGQTISGEYKYDSKTNTLEVNMLGNTAECYVEGNSFNLEGATYTRNHVDQADLSDLAGELPDLDLSDFGLD